MTTRTLPTDVLLRRGKGGRRAKVPPNYRLPPLEWGMILDDAEPPRDRSGQSAENGLREPYWHGQTRADGIA